VSCLLLFINYTTIITNWAFWVNRFSPVLAYGVWCGVYTTCDFVLFWGEKAGRGQTKCCEHGVLIPGVF
jgi:hypothetical protein